MLTLLAAVVLSQTASCGALSRAQSPGGECPASVKRRDFGWLGLLPQNKAWALVPLRTRKDDGGESFNGLCAKEENVALALKSESVKPGPLELVRLEGNGDCALPLTKVKLAGTTWTLSSSDTALRLATKGQTLDFAWNSTCWTEALFGDLDRDGLPDLVLSRVGGGYVTVLFLSTLQSRGVVSGCAQMNGPND